MALPICVSCSSSEEERASSPLVTIRASENDVTPLDPEYAEDDPGEGEEPVADVGARDSRASDSSNDCACDSVATGETAAPDAEEEPSEG